MVVIPPSRRQSAAKGTATNVPWADHPLAAGDNDLIRIVVKHLGINARDYLNLACVCKGLFATVRSILARPPSIFRFGVLPMPDWSPAMATLPPENSRAMTRSRSRNLAHTRNVEAQALARASTIATCVAFHPLFSAIFMVGYADGTIHSWFAPLDRPMRGYRRPIHEDADVSTLSVQHMAFSADGLSLLACWGTGWVQPYRVVGNNDCKGVKLETTNGVLFSHSATWGEFVPSSNQMAICANGVCFLDRDTLAAGWNHTAGARISCFTSDGRFSATSTNNDVFIHDVRLQTRMFILRASLVRGMAWSPDNDVLIVSCRTGKAFTFHRSIEKFTLVSPMDPFHIMNTRRVTTPACWSPDGSLAFFPHTAGGMTIMNTKDGSCRHRVIDDNTNDVIVIAFSPDARAGVALMASLNNDVRQVITFQV